MSTMQAPPAPADHEPATQQPRLPSHVPRRRAWLRAGRLVALAPVIALIAIGLPAALSWIEFRRTHSITDDAFVEAHIVNVAPQVVSGRVIQLLADENDQVKQGQVIAEIDPTPYRDKVNVAQASWKPRGPNSLASAPTWTASAKKCQSRSRSPGGRQPLPLRIGDGRRNP